MTVYLRFVVKRLDPNSGRRQGIFQAIGELRDSVLVSANEHRILREHSDWFNTHLERPSRFSLSPRPNARAQAISWFKGSAAKHIAKMRECVWLLEQHGYMIDVLKTKRPGYVVYEDEFQVTAYPFDETPT